MSSVTVEGATGATQTPTEAPSYLAQRVGVSVVLALLMAATVGLNVCVLVVYARVRRLRVPANFLLVGVTVADLLSVPLWELPSLVTAARWRWLLGDGFCQAEGSLAATLYAVNVVSLLVLGAERALFFWSPSRHRQAFTRTVTAILAAAIWLLALVFGIMPHLGWGQIAYVRPYFDCIINFGSSFSLLQFFTIAGYFVPLVLMTAFYAAVYYRYRRVRAGQDGLGRITLEDREDRPKESYAQRLAQQGRRYRHAPQRTAWTRPPSDDTKAHETQGSASSNDTTAPRDTRGSRSDDDGYNSDPDRLAARRVADVDSDTDSEEEWTRDAGYGDYYLDYADAIHERREALRRARRQRQFRLYRAQVGRTRALFLCTAVYMALWLPYFVLSYVWVYRFYPLYSDEDLHTALTLIALASSAYKPLVYISDRSLRRAARTALHPAWSRATTDTPATEEQTRLVSDTPL